MLRTSVLIVVQLAVLGVLLAGAEGAYFLARRAKEDADTTRRGHLSTIQTAMLALFGLLLAFISSMAETRFAHRRTLVLEEANAIGTTYLRADFFGPTEAPEVQSLLRRYADNRIAFNRAGVLSDEQRFSAEAATLQSEIWHHAVALLSRPGHERAGELFVTTTNAMIDLEGAQRAALDTHVPASLFVLLVVVAFFAVSLTGHLHGVTKRRTTLGLTVMPALLAVAIAVVVDLDAPRVGLIRASIGPLLEQRRSMGMSLVEQ